MPYRYQLTAKGMVKKSIRAKRKPKKEGIGFSEQSDLWKKVNEEILDTNHSVKMDEIE